MIWWPKIFFGRKCRPGDRIFPALPRGNPNIIIEMDASQAGWGARCGNFQTGGPWFPKRSSNAHQQYCLELLAATLAIETFAKRKENLQVSSHHSHNAKRSVARALFERVSYVTGEEKRKTESGTIEEELKLNNYPHEIIIRERRKAIKKQRERAEGRAESGRTTGEETRKKATISIPYIHSPRDGQRAGGRLVRRRGKRRRSASRTFKVPVKQFGECLVS